MDRRRLEQIEKYVISYFQEQQQSRILAKDLFNSTSDYANADIVRALEDLEKVSVYWSSHNRRQRLRLTDAVGVTLLGLQER